MSSSQYPEHEKLSAISAESQAIGQFLDEGTYTLCEVDKYDRFVPVGKSIQEILADYFGIDLNKIEAEKRQMLDEIRGANNG